MSPRPISASRRAGKSRLATRRRIFGASIAQRAVTMEGLEERVLLTALPHPTYVVYHPLGIAPAASSSPQGYTPAQVRKAYGFDSILVGGIVGDGTGQTVAIVDAYDQPNIIADLKAFDLQFGLPDPPSFTVLNQRGQTSPLPSPDPAHGWGGETSLDVEWVHSVAPMANIILVEADNAGTLLPQAVAMAASLPGVSAVSMSFGIDGLDANPSQDPVFTTPNGHAGVTFLASTGDSGAPGGYPAYSPNVVAVGGTSLFLNADNSYRSESGWSGGGGGESTTEAKPSYQSGTSYTHRTIPDVSMIADPNTGVAVYDSYDNGSSTPWEAVGGTSLACPIWAGLIAIVNQERVATGSAVLDGVKDTLPLLYSLPATDFHDVTTGNNGFAAGPGYDLVTGLGTPRVPQLVADLAPLSITVQVTPPTTFVEGVPLTNVQVATFHDSTGLLPSSDYTATITWGDGTNPTTVAGASIVSLGNGNFSVLASHTYAEEGTYTIVVAVTSTLGTGGQGTSTLTVGDAPLTPISTTFTGVEGAKFTGVVGSFVDGNPNAPLSDFTASIDWGDGKVTSGTITQSSSGAFIVSGSNTYKKYGTYNVTVSVKDVGGSTTTIDTVATIADAPLSSTSKTFSGVAGAALNTTIASFTDADPGTLATQYSVTIDWGDNTTSTLPAVQVINRGSRFDVIAGHTYTRFGTYTVSTTISDDGGSTTTAVSTANISDAAIAATSSNFSTTIGQAFSGQVASFTSANPFALTSDFSATVSWGDNTTSSVTGPGIVSLASGKFGVFASHTYSTVGTYNVQVNIVSLGGSQALAIGTGTITDAAIAVTTYPQSAVAGAFINGEIATFSDAYALAPISQFTATIDWGDGSAVETVAPSQITQPNGVGTAFYVAGSHAYKRADSYAITVSVSDSAGTSSAAQGAVVITDAPFTVSTIPLTSLTQGVPFFGTVGSFTTTNPIALQSDYLASINWGDGTSSGGLVSTTSTGGSFAVTANPPHTYTAPGHYAVSLTVISLGGNRQVAAAVQTVKDAPIVGVPGSPIQAVAGTTFSGVVGSFTQYALAPISTFVATINWGDGQTSQGTIGTGTNGAFTVTGSNLYRTAGSYSPTVIVTDSAGTIGSFSVGATITDPPITITTTPISTVRGQGFSGVIATVTEPNLYATASEFTATINWGDGTAATTGSVTGSAGTFTVSAAHVFNTASQNTPITITVVHSGGASVAGVDSAHVLVPISGFLYAGSDSGVSNSDGITSNTTPIYVGFAEPNSVVKVYAAPTSNPSAVSLVGTSEADATGLWAIMISPLGTGSYVVTASMTDSSTNTNVQNTTLSSGSSGALNIATSGPTVAGVTFDARAGQLHVLFQTGTGSMNLGGLLNAANYSLGLPVGLGLQSFAPTAITATPAGNGQILVNVNYALGKKHSAGGYVVELHSLGLTDLAGNILNERTFLTFPQTTNFPNPDYVAQIDVNKSLASSSAHQYISKAEQIAARNFANQSQKTKVVRLPKNAAATISAASVPQPTSFAKKRR